MDKAPPIDPSAWSVSVADSELDSGPLRTETNKGVWFDFFLRLDRQWLALALVVSVALVSALSLSTLAEGLSLGARLESLPNGLFRVDWVLPGGYAAEAGLRAGDVIALASEAEGTATWTITKMGDGDMASAVPLQRRWPMGVTYLTFALGLEFMLAGLLVILRASDRPAANRFFSIASVMAVTLVAFPATGNGHPWALAIAWLGSTLALAALVDFSLTTPVRRWPLIRWFLTLAPVPILAFYVFTLLGHVDQYPLVKALGYWYGILAIVTGMAALLLPLARRRMARQCHMWPVGVACGVAASVYFASTIVPVIGLTPPNVPAEVAISGLALIPLAFTWSILHRPLTGLRLGPGAAFQAIVDTIADPLLVVDRDGSVVEVSASGLALLGVDRRDDARAACERLLAQVSYHTESGAVTPLIDGVFRGEAVRDLEVGVSLGNGRLAYVGVNASPVFDERSEVEMAVVVLREVTERYQREARIREAMEREDEAHARVEQLVAENAAILECIGDAVVLADREGAVVHTNEAAKRILGVETAQAALSPEMGGVHVLDNNDEALAEERIALNRAALHGETVIGEACQVRRADGVTVQVVASAAPVVTERQERLGAVMTLRDVTVQHETNRRKDEFLAKVSLALRAPLASIKSSVDALLASEAVGTTEPLRAVIDDIEASVDSMAGLVNDALELERLRSGLVTPRLEVYDLRPLAERCADVVRPVLKEKHQSLKLYLASEPCWALVDERYLERALLILLTTASGYGRKRGRIEVAVTRSICEVTISIGDNGPGIALDEQERVFEGFYRPRAMTSADALGEGLGLPMTRAIVDLHGGRVWLDSRPGEGCTFGVSLPTTAKEDGAEGLS